MVSDVDSMEPIAIKVGSTGSIECSSLNKDSMMTDQLKAALVRKREFLKRTGISNSTFYTRIKEGVIKPGVPLGPRMKAWPESEVQAYINSCIAARDANESVVIACHQIT